ncbi:hypothetical protein TCAL_15746 [Tigriopus californicus]|uniref:Uncharacterized protein n=1 Tax=Tigriopus californicus TaxID=6832 RepID=A0A553P877_TIGCA|nr:hypothetical protein TCAL_15746 [Tigriopus californicus]
MSTLGRKTPSLVGQGFCVLPWVHGSNLARWNIEKERYQTCSIAVVQEPLIQYRSIRTFSGVLAHWILHIGCSRSSTTGYYIFSFDFVYVGNPHVRNLLSLPMPFPSLALLLLLVTSVMLFDALRKEQETAFKAIVNDMIFSYNIVMFIAWLVFNILNLLSCACIFSLYLELNDLTKLQDLARLKWTTIVLCPPQERQDTFGSRPTSPYVNRDTMREESTTKRGF